MAQFYKLQTDKDVEFTGAIVQNASEQENIVLTPTLQGVNGTAQVFIRAIGIISDQNLAWELQFWSTDGFEDSNLDLDSNVGRWTFQAADGVQIAGTGSYYYYIDGLSIPYYDDDHTGELHVSLVNRSATSKNAGATGEIVVKVWAEPMGWGEGA